MKVLLPIWGNFLRQTQLFRSYSLLSNSRSFTFRCRKSKQEICTKLQSKREDLRNMLTSSMKMLSGWHQIELLPRLKLKKFWDFIDLTRTKKASMHLHNMNIRAWVSSKDKSIWCHRLWASSQISVLSKLLNQDLSTNSLCWLIQWLSQGLFCRAIILKNS
jgi:hypothetical protein